MKTKKIIRLKDVIAKCGLSKSTIYLQIAKGTFPKQVLLTQRCVGWIEDDIDQWISKRENIS